MIYDEDDKLRSSVKVTMVVMALVVLAGVMHWAGFKLVRQEPDVRWLDQPLTFERNAQGQPVATIVLGFGSDGIVRWGRAPLPPPPTTQPETPDEKKFVDQGKKEAVDGKPAAKPK